MTRSIKRGSIWKAFLVASAKWKHKKRVERRKATVRRDAGPRC